MLFNRASCVYDEGFKIVKMNQQPSFTHAGNRGVF